MVHTFEAVAGSWRSVSAPAVRRVMGGAPERKKRHLGKGFCKCCRQYCEMCFIPTNIHNELFNGVRQLKWQHLSPVVSTFSTSFRLLSSFFIKHSILPPSYCLSSLSVVPHPVFLISGLSMRIGDVNVFFLQSKVLCGYKHSLSSEHLQ